MPYIDSQTAPDLEELSGADMLITLENFPASTEKLIQRHLDAGAILVQRKHGEDLLRSLGRRINTSLGRMFQYRARPAQRVLLFIGILTCDRDERAVINGLDTSISYWSAQAALDKWCDRGGVVKTLSRDSLIPSWIAKVQERLAEYRNVPVKEVWPEGAPILEIERGDPLQELKPVSIRSGAPGYWRPFLAGLPGLGPVRVNAIFDYIKANGMQDDPLAALTVLTNHTVKGIGPSLRMNIREWLGLSNIYDLSVVVRSEHMVPAETTDAKV